MSFSLSARSILAVGLCVLGAAAVATLAFASHGGDDGVLRIEAREGGIDVESGELAGGRRVIEVANGGTVEHELVVVRTDRAADAIPVGLGGVSPSLAGRLIVGEDHAAAGHDHAPEETLGQLPGEARRYQVELRRGRYVVLCQTDDHYLQGEATSFEVR